MQKSTEKQSERKKMCRNIFKKFQESKKTPSRFEPTRRFVYFALKGFKQYFSPFTFAEAYATTAQAKEENLLIHI